MEPIILQEARFEPYSPGVIDLEEFLDIERLCEGTSTPLKSAQPLTPLNEIPIPAATSKQQCSEKKRQDDTQRGYERNLSFNQPRRKGIRSTVSVPEYSVICFPSNPTKPDGIKKKRKDFDEKRRLEVARVRKTGACFRCKVRRISYSRSRDATLTLRNLASAERCAPKRTDGDAGLPPPNERSGTQPTSPEKLRQRHAARRLFRESLSQPHVVLGTPIPPTQQSTRRFRALAPSPPVQPTAHPIASHSDPSTVRSSTTGLGYSYLAARFHKGGKDSQDEPSKAVARAKQAAIQRDHRSRRRVGETVSLTPTISQLGVFGDFEGPGEDASQDRLQPSELLGGDEIRKEGDDRGQFSESDIDAEDYFNLLLSPARPRRYLKQLGVESDPDLGDEHENSDNDCVDGSPLRHRLRQPSARPRRGRRGPAPGTGGRPRKSPRQARSSMPPRRIRSPVIIPPEELAVFHAQDPVWNGDLDACALTDRDKATLREFWTTLDNDQMEYCTRCQECWFQMKIDSDGICERCYRKDRKRRPDEPYFFSADNQLDFGPVPARLPQLTPTEESLLARVHVHVNIMLVRGQQYKYRGHVVHFLREVGLVYNQLPLLPQELNTVLLRPANTSSHANLSRQFTRQFRVRRQPVVIWLDYLRRHHPGYRCVVIDEERLNQLPQDGNVLDAIPQSQVETADVGPDSPEEDQEAEPDLEDEAAVPDLLAKDTELDALRSILSGESGADSELSTSFQAQAQHELQLPNIRHTPINEFNRSHALLSLAFPCLFPDGRADFVEPRLRSIDYRDYVEHAMRWHDGRFARHPTFRFVAFNTLMRSQARSRSRFFVKQQDGRQQPLTREQLIQALEHSEDPEAQALINSITRHAVSIRGTRPFWNKRRQDLEAYAYNLGCPGAFITFSPADLHWRSLYQHMPQYDDWLAATEPERMALSRRLLRQNPHIAAFHFYRRYCLFRDIVLSKKFNITDYWDRYEWQGRGSPHNHGLYWMDSCPGTDMDDEAARDVFARTWGFHVTAINPEPSRAMPQGEGNPLSVDPLSIEMTFLRLSQIVNRCQRHKCNTTYCLRVRKRTGDLARDMEGAAADIEAANVANPERECRFDFPRALRELAAVIRKEGRSYYVFEAARNDSLMNHFNPAIILGWLANIDISPCTSLQAVITYAAKYCSKSEKKTEPYCKLADQVLPHTAHLQPLLSFSSRLMNKLIAERDYSAQEISHLLLNIPLQEGTRMVVVVDCRPLELHGRSYRVDEDVIETVGSYRKYLERNDQHEDVTYLEYLQSYNLKTWRRLAANAKKRVLSYFPRYKSIEASPQFNDFCRVKLMMAHPHRSPRELLVMDGQRFDSFAAAYKFCRQLHHTHADDHYGDPDAKELRAEDDEFEPEAHEEPVTEEDWHELARMLPDRPLEEEDIDILGRRDIDINYDWTSHVGRYTDDGILNGDYWKQRKAENLLDLDVDDQPLEARDSLNPEQRLVYDTVMDHFLTQNPSQLLLHVDGGGGTGKSYLINLLSAHLQAATGGRGTPVWRAAPTGVAGNQISGTTLHSLLHLPINKDFRPLSPIDKAQLQKKLKDIKYLIIDEKSMLGLRQLSWIDDRLREAFPSRNEEFFGGLNILLVGDFFQLPPVLQKPLYYDKEVQGVEIKGRNAYRRFDKTVFLKVVQRQRGDDQEAFRTALGELRLLQLSKESWKLLSSRVQAKLDDREVARFVNALRVYATKDRVNEYNHYHLDRLSRPAIQVTAKNVGSGAAAAPDDKAGNLAKQIPICLGARLMLTSNLWQPVGLCNGARGTVYDIGWAPGAEPIQDPPCVIMMEFDKYNGPVFLTTPDGKKIVPILPVERDFLIGATLCTRTQFPLIVCYAITVHKSQSITEDMIVTDLSCRDFQTGLSYVAVSRVKTLEGLMLDAPFDRNHLIYASPPDDLHYIDYTARLLNQELIAGTTHLGPHRKVSLSMDYLDNPALEVEVQDYYGNTTPPWFCCWVVTDQVGEQVESYRQESARYALPQLLPPSQLIDWVERMIVHQDTRCIGFQQTVDSFILRYSQSEASLPMCAFVRKVHRLNCLTKIRLGLILCVEREGSMTPPSCALHTQFGQISKAASQPIEKEVLLELEKVVFGTVGIGPDNSIALWASLWCLILMYRKLVHTYVAFQEFPCHVPEDYSGFPECKLEVGTHFYHYLVSIYAALFRVTSPLYADFRVAATRKLLNDDESLIEAFMSLRTESFYFR
ncbi:ATP-dependent DNA helicase pif1 [Fusarium oxysporum f. sp. conglutinans]|nr:ATP-dependent DNA helicase pif1 [Fusarium oxysporum f. sp. conglutinans]